jgi:hypothetical protein
VAAQEPAQGLLWTVTPLAMTAERQLLAANNAVTDAYSTALSAAATLALSAGELGGPPR